MVQRSRGLLLLVLFAPMLLQPTLGQDDAAPGPEALYFLDARPPNDEYNLTTYAPTAADNASSIQFVSTGFEAHVTWVIPRLPAPWNVTSGASSQATLYLSGLDQLFPHPPEDPQEAIETAGRIRIDVLVWGADGQTVTEGQALFEPQLATPRDEVFRIDVALTAGQDLLLDPAEGTGQITLRIVVSGREMGGTNVSPVHIHVMAPQTPSQVTLDGFPVAAFRAWEDAERETERRASEILTGRRGPTSTPATNETDAGNDTVANTPAPEFIWILTAGLAAGLAAQREREPRRGRRQ